MNRTFFITGFPRSRTAWLANAMTFGPSYCYHDAIRLVHDVSQLPFVLNRKPVCGDSDSGLLFVWRSVLTLFPDARWLLVMRDMQQCYDSFQRYLPRVGMTAEHFGHMGKELRALTCAVEDRSLVVPYDALDDPAVGERIWRHCVGGPGFDPVRWQMLSEWRVEAIAAKEIANSDPHVRDAMVIAMRN